MLRLWGPRSFYFSVPSAFFFRTTKSGKPRSYPVVQCGKLPPIKLEGQGLMGQTRPTAPCEDCLLQRLCSVELNPKQEKVESPAEVWDSGIYTLGQILGIPTKFLVDTGAAVSILSQDMYWKIPSHKRPAFQETDIINKRGVWESARSHRCRSGTRCLPGHVVYARLLDCRYSSRSDSRTGYADEKSGKAGLRSSHTQT